MSEMTLNKKFAATIVAAAVVTLYGCGKEEPKKAEAPKAPAAPPVEQILVVKIGHAGPLTGGIAHLGKDNENGARLAVEEANAAKITIDGKETKFVLIAEDDQADPKVGTTVAQKLVDAKVAGVVGHLNSGTSIPASALYNAAGVPVISGSATNPKLTEQGFKTQFRVVGRDDQLLLLHVQLDGALRTFEVVALGDLLAGLVHRIVDLLKVDLRNNVE
jgi:branched-chain amino acid transport system substrate-binding protein